MTDPDRGENTVSGKFLQYSIAVDPGAGKIQPIINSFCRLYRLTPERGNTLQGQLSANTEAADPDQGKYKQSEWWFVHAPG
jgi:hypothetical protein